MFGINQLVDFHFRDRRVRKEYEELKERRERRYIIIITPNGTQLEEKMIRVSSLDSKMIQCHTRLLSFEWSDTCVSSTDQKVRTTLC